MEALGVPVDFLVGTSIGATVGGFYLANGLEASIALAKSFPTPAGALRRFLDPTVRRTGAIEGHRLLRFFERNLEIERIEDLEIPYAAIALDLETGDEHVARAGRLADAMRASGVMPGMVAPYSYQPPGAARPGRFVDGSLVNLVPVDRVRALGADRVVGVHVMHVRDLLVPSALQLGPEATANTTNLMQAHLLALARAGERQVFAADVAVLPDAGAFGLSEVWRGSELIEVGRKAAMAEGERLLALNR
jgi:NTE family protein